MKVALGISKAPRQGSTLSSCAAQETQTKPEGQIHFFPIIFNAEQLYNTMVERCGPSQNSAPKA